MQNFVSLALFLYFPRAIDKKAKFSKFSGVGIRNWP